MIKKCFLAFFFILVGTAILSSLHIHNGFPLLMGDSAGYISRAHMLLESSHYSNIYSAIIFVFINIFESIQGVVIFQNVLVAIVLLIFLRTYVERFNYIKYLIVLILLSFTTLPWFSNLLMSDIFTPLCLLSLLLILDRKVLNTDYLILVSIAFISASTHQSHLIIVPLFCIAFILLKYVTKKKVDFKSIGINLCCIAVLILGSNYLEKNILNPKDSRKEYSPKSKSDISSGYYFIAIRIAESGELNYMLDQYCDPKRESYLCHEVGGHDISKIKNVRISERSADNSLYLFYSKQNKDFVLFAVTKLRFYYGMFKLLYKRGFVALTNMNLRRYGPGKDSLVNRFKSVITRISSKDLAAYNESRQIQRAYPKFIRYTYTPIHNFWWRILFPITIICLVYLCFNKKSGFSIKYKHILFFLIFGHVLNTLVCGTFSNNENSRYVTRTLWFINLVFLLLWMQIFQHIVVRKLQEKL